LAFILSQYWLHLGVVSEIAEKILDVVTLAAQKAKPIPYHTSILSGAGWMTELLNGHPERIRTELAVHKHMFKILRTELQWAGCKDSKYVTLEEQLGIFLYTCVTGLSIRHIGERFQRSNSTVSK